LQRLDRRTAVAACLITVAKLAVYPMLVWLILGRMMQLDAFWVNVGVLIACQPSAGNIYVLAQRYDADPQRVSAAILLSTIVSVVSFPCVAWLALSTKARRYPYQSHEGFNEFDRPVTQYRPESRPNASG
jgi:malonate transporter and related proteins